MPATGFAVQPYGPTNTRSVSFERFDSQLQGRCKNSRKIGNNTYLERRGDKIAVRLHNTDIITIERGDTITVSSGGWQTVTTKARLNEFLPIGFGIGQDKGLWYWYKHGGTGDREYFHDGDKLVIKDRKYVIESSVKGFNPKAVEKLRKEIREYAKGFAKAIPVDRPSGGDCWFCALITGDKKPWGEAIGDKDHLLQHIKTRYYVPSLLAHALEEFGASQVAKASAFKYGDPPNDWMLGVARRQIEACVKRYLYRHLGLPA